MTSVTIDLPDDQAATLRAKAAAQGLSLEAWFKKMAEQETPPDEQRAAHAVSRILEIQKRVKPDPEGWTVQDYINHGRP